MIKPNNSKENKIKNRKNVLKMLMLHAPISRIELSKKTGLSKMTLTNIMNEFIKENIVCEMEKDTKTTSGRKPIMLSLTDTGMLSIGIYISRYYTRGCILTLSGKILKQIKIPLGKKDSRDTLIAKVLKITRKLLAQKFSDQIIGIGIAAIGPVHRNDGIILNPPVFYGIQNVPIKQIIQEEFGLPTYFDNDTNLAALAEKYFGLAKEMKDFIYLGVSGGIGSGIITGNRLLLGKMGFVGEVGHTTIAYDGKVCSCGRNGCLERYADCNAVVEEAENALKNDGFLAGKEPITYEEIARGLKVNDPLCVKLIETQCRFLSYAMVDLINLFNPECIILGHEIAHAGEFAIKYLEQIIKGKTLGSGYVRTPLYISSFFDRAPLIGAATLVFDENL